jgi:hypothetical protein
MKSSTRRIPTVVLAVTIAATLLTTAFITSNSLLQSVFAQQPQPPTQQQQAKAPLNFYLKLANNASTAQAASQAAANGTGTKNMTIAVNVQKGPSGQQIALPISAIVPANIQPQDLQLCASLADGSESCQPLSGGQQAASIDLTQTAVGGATAAAPPTATTSPMPAPAPQSYPKNDDGTTYTNIISPILNTITSAIIMQHADAQLISVEDTTINIPITVIVPIDLNIQNAQICASVASSGDQSCTQAVLNPEQTSYTDVEVDLSSTTPTFTTAEPTTATTQTAPTTEPTAPTTTTETAPTTTTEPAPTEEPTDTTEEPSTDTGTEESDTTTEEPTPDGSTSDGGS